MFNGAFSISQTTDPQSFTLTDTSTGTDAGLTDRQITLFKSDGTTLVPAGSATSYIDWPIANGPILIPLLIRDYALNIQVNWISSAPLAPPSTYTLTILNGFTSNSESFYGSLTQKQSQNRLLVNDNNFWPNKSKLRTLIDDCTQAVDVLNNILLAQDSLDEAYQMIQNPNQSFR